MSSYCNAYGLRVGMDGTLSGIHFRVVGRVVLSTQADGETYFWQEFNLHEDSGNEATLVLEEGDNGPEWKLFMAFEPNQPLSAAEAAGKQVGDAVNLEGRPVRITYVGRSRVVHIEGQAPEGVEVGDVADYFNADEGARMLVVSWTGDEIEYYRGMDVPTSEVRTAFGLPSFSSGAGGGLAFVRNSTAAPASSRVVGVFVLLILVVVAGIAIYSNGSSGKRSAGVQKIAARVAPLAVGKGGPAEGKNFTIVGYAEMEIASTSARYVWHEYNLRAEDGDTALLVGGLSPGANVWFLFRPVQGEELPSPLNAAALRGGDVLNLAGRPLRVSDLFQCRLVYRKGQTAPEAEFGFLAGSEKERALARWSDSVIEYYLGKQVATKEVEAAFASKGQ